MRTAMNRIAEIYRVELHRQLEETAEFFERALVITPFAGDGKNDVVVTEAFGRSEAMQGVRHLALTVAGSV